VSVRISVIVPLHRLTDAARRCLREVAALSGGRHEVIAVSDWPVEERLPDGVRLILTGAGQDTSPAEKRDVALEHVRGEICAFLDDDAYPAPDWIDCALARFDADASIVAVGGPGVTPPGSSLLERLGGAFYESRLGSGGLRYRFRPDGDVRDVDDFPAYNFFVRTDALRELGGWNSRFYGGEDTKLCLLLVQGGHRLVYDPAVLVYHFRRPMFRAHMRQVANVGRHRGYFVRVHPETSARPIYFGPAAAVIAAPLVLGWAARSPGRMRALGAAGLAGAGLIAAVARREGHDPEVSALLPVALAAGHGAYGVGFLRGLATTHIEEM
jgi:glycosyltransferase involved in cell wall biosynthesis